MYRIPFLKLLIQKNGNIKLAFYSRETILSIQDPVDLERKEIML